MAQARTGLVMLALLIVYVVWGSTYLAISIVTEQADPLASMGVRYVVAGVILAVVLVVARRSGRGLRITARQAAGTAVLGLLLPLCGNGMVAVAESRDLPSGVTALLIAMAPLFIVLFRAVDRDRPPGVTIVGVLLGFAGLIALVTLGHGVDGLPLGPSLIALFATTCWATGSYLQPRLWLPGDAFLVAVYEMLWGGLFLLLLGLGTGERLTIHYPARTWLAWSYLVVAGSVVGFTAYVWLVASAPISLVATYAYVNPVIAVFLGWLILDEAVTWPIAVGGLIVVAGVALVITAERPRLPARRSRAPQRAA